MGKHKISIGICAHNEEKNIEKLLSLLEKEKPADAAIEEIIVVSSGSTDKTDSIVESFAGRDGRVLLVKEKVKKGKTAALNRILSIAKGEVIVLIGADVLPEKGAIGSLVKKFQNKKVGMAGARIVPLNNPDSFTGYCGHLVWKLHHSISLRFPKCGELVAFRNVVAEVPPDVGADEAYLEHAILSKGYSISYAADAIAHNMAPKSVSGFIAQRKRVYAEHCHLRHSFSYAVPTMKASAVFPLLFRTEIRGVKELFFFFGAVFLEAFARALGAFDYYISGNVHSSWKPIKSTKEVKG